MTPTAVRALVRAGLDDGITLRQQIASTGIEPIVAGATLLVERLRRGHQVLLCGNGGSAADAQHIAAELTGRFARPDRRPLPAVALTTDTSALTAVANDMGFAEVFARQVEALSRPGDVLVALSTSGRSPNVVAAAERAAGRGVTVVALTGPDPGALGAKADLVISVPGRSAARIQELHITVGHLLCEAVDDFLDR